jgi:hypothetical protein
MYLYAGLFESMMAYCGRAGFRQGPIYTLTMMALGLGVTLNLLSVIHLLWTLGVVDNPYRIDGDLHSQRYVLGMLYLAFLANTVLARLKFSADRGRVQRIARVDASEAAAPVYVLASMFFFVLTLSLSLRIP